MTELIPGQRSKRLRRSTSVHNGVDEPAIRYHCNYCEKDISDIVRIKCAVCPDFDLCVHCFSVGVEITPHKNTHAYRIMQILDFPLFSADWDADEELMLLEGIEIYGMGNWQEVSKHVATKTSLACEDHYYKVYFDSPTAPRPDLTTPLPPPHEEKRPPISRVQVAAATREREKQEQRAMMPVVIVSNPKGDKSASTPAELAGYMPKRGEFETEWDNDFELIVAGLDFRRDEHAIDTELKLRMVDIYGAILDERDARKRFVLERNLVDPKRMNSFERRKNKDEREIATQYRAFARFHSQRDHEELIYGLCEERKLLQQIEDYKFYRSLGIRDIAEVKEFERSQAQKESTRSYDPYAFPARSSHRGTKYVARDGDYAPAPPRRAGGSSSGWDISNTPGVELLSPGEHDLCVKLRLMPHKYMVYKDTMVRACFKRGFLKKSAAIKMLKMDVHKSGQLYEFLLTNGWINAVPLPNVPQPLPVTTTSAPDGTNVMQTR